MIYIIIYTLNYTIVSSGILNFYFIYRHACILMVRLQRLCVSSERKCECEQLYSFFFSLITIFLYYEDKFKKKQNG